MSAAEGTTIRSVCLVVDDARVVDPPGIDELCRTMAAGGIAVHVLGWGPASDSDSAPAYQRTVRPDATIHRLVPAVHPLDGRAEVRATLRAAAAAELYRALDAAVDFDVVVALADPAIVATLDLAERTLLATWLDPALDTSAGADPDRRGEPGRAVAGMLRRLGTCRSDVVLVASGAAARRLASTLGDDAPPVEVVAGPGPVLAALARHHSGRAAAPQAPRPETATTPSGRGGPTVGVVVAYDDPSAAQRCVRSLLAHTEIALQLVAVSRQPAPSPLGVPGGGLELVTPPGPLTAAEAFNLGLDHLRGDEDWIVLVDGGAEMTSGWWDAFVAALEADREAGLAWPGELEAPGPCAVLRGRVTELVGRFDAAAARPDADYRARAARLGERSVAVRTERVLNHRDPVRAGATPPAAGMRSPRAAPPEDAAGGPFLVAALAEHVLGDPGILATFGGAFTHQDPAALVVWGPGLDPTAFEAALAEVARLADFDLAGGPKLLALLPPHDEAADRELADQVRAVIAPARPTGALSHLPLVRPGGADRLRLLAARAWRAEHQHRRVPPSGGSAL